jgi:hypothetical protein
LRSIQSPSRGWRNFLLAFLVLYAAGAAAEEPPRVLDPYSSNHGYAPPAYPPPPQAYPPPPAQCSPYGCPQQQPCPYPQQQCPYPQQPYYPQQQQYPYYYPPPAQPMDPYAQGLQQPPLGAPPSYVSLPRPMQPKRRLLARLSAGYGYRYMLGENWNAGSAELLLGTSGDRGGAAGRISLDAGRTPTGWHFEVITVGGNFDFKIGRRFRLGFSPNLGVLVVNGTADGSEPTWITVVFGTHIEGSVDLVQNSRGGALVLLGRVGYDMVLAGNNFNAVLVRLALGYRF